MCAGDDTATLCLVPVPRLSCGRLVTVLSRARADQEVRRVPEHWGCITNTAQKISDPSLLLPQGDPGPGGEPGQRGPPGEAGPEVQSHGIVSEQTLLEGTWLPDVSTGSQWAFPFCKKPHF